MFLATSHTKAVATFCGLVTGFLAVPSPATWAKQPFYYPATVGDTYVVRGTGHEKGGPERTAEWTGRVVAVRESPDGVEVTTELVSGTRNEPYTKVRLTDKGIFLLTKGDKALNPPLFVFPSTPKPGKSWEVPKSSEFPAPIKYTVGNEEEVEVAGRKFKAVRVDGIAECEGVTVRRTEWYAPGVGAVKAVTTGSDGAEYVLELKSFTPGKK